MCNLVKFYCQSTKQLEQTRFLQTARIKQMYLSFEWRILEIIADCPVKKIRINAGPQTP